MADAKILVRLLKTRSPEIMAEDMRAAMQVRILAGPTSGIEMGEIGDSAGVGPGSRCRILMKYEHRRNPQHTEDAKAEG